MDNLHAPQWVDFNASDRSDIDDFFNIEHKELETGYRCTSSPDSIVDSPFSKRSSEGSVAQSTPRANGYASPSVYGASGGRPRFNRTSESLVKAMNALHIKSAKKALLRPSMTPNAKTPSANSTMIAAAVEEDVVVQTEMEECKIKDVQDADRVEVSVQEQPEALSAPVVAIEEEEGSSDVPVGKIESADAGNNAEPEPESAEVVQHFSEPEEKPSDISPITEENLGNPCAKSEEKSSNVPSESEEKLSNVRSESEEKSSNVRSESEEKSSNVRSESEEKLSDLGSKPEVNPSNSKVAKNPSNTRSAPKEKSSGVRPKVESVLDPSKQSLLANRKKPRAKPENARVLANTVRRHSIAKYRRRTSGQYVGLAEAVARFQNETPKRFRSTNHRDNQPGPLQKTKQTKMKLTTAQSPALLCKTRTRAISTSSAAQQNRVVDPKSFAQSLRSTQPTSSHTSKLPKRAEKSPTAAAAAKPKPMLPPEVAEVARNIEKQLPIQSLTNDPSAILSSMLSTSMMSSSIVPESARKHTPCKKTVPTVVSLDDGKAIQQVEVLHFGIPVGKNYKKNTRPIPFSFETRTKALQNKREKKEQTKDKPMKAYARPASNVNPAKKTTATMTTTATATTSTTTTTSVLKPKENNASKVPLSTLTFQQRNELALKKKRELMDQIVEKEKQARIFHAKPAPHFKPVFVRGNSDLRDGGKAKTRGISPGPGQRGQNQDSNAFNNQENKAPNKTK